MRGTMIENIADNFLNFDLRDLVPLIDGENYYWRMLYFYAHGFSDPEFDLQEFERQALTLENGVAMTWDEVRNLGLKVGQTIDCLLIGDRKEANLKRYKTEEEQYTASEIVLELIDGGCWEIRAKDPSIIERIVRHFDGNTKFKISEI